MDLRLSAKLLACAAIVASRQRAQQARDALRRRTLIALVAGLAIPAAVIALSPGASVARGPSVANPASFFSNDAASFEARPQAAPDLPAASAPSVERKSMASGG